MDKRIRKHLLRRLHRQAIRSALTAANLTGLVTHDKRVIEGIEVTRYRIGPRPFKSTGNDDRDSAIIMRRLNREAVQPSLLPEIADGSFELNATISNIEAGTVAAKDQTRESLTSPPIEENAYIQNSAAIERDQLDHALALVRGAASGPSVAETAVCLMVTASITERQQVLNAISEIAPFVCLSVPIKGFEEALGSMLECGVLSRYPLILKDGADTYSLSRRIHSDDAPYNHCTATTFRLSDLHNSSQDRVRRWIGRAEARGRPIIIATENQLEWPRRIVSSADLMIDAAYLDWPILADLIELCSDVPATEVIQTRKLYRIDTWRLGLDDLALAIKPGRDVHDILTRLEAFSREEAIASGDERERPTEKAQKPTERETTTSTSAENSKETTTKRIDKKLALDIIYPAKNEKSRSRRTAGDKPILFLESLSGYGSARDWALELKADLVLWKAKKLDWSDMSTKLLLSGPPGTGKTTFAKALCNSLDIPLIATSVAHWLEPGYLGDVLKRISGVFDAASQHQPVILFVDELDGIGRRDSGAGRNYDDYWVSVINRVLERLDGAVKSEGIIVVGATNRPEVIDPAIRRSGRLERHIIIPPPDLDALAGIIRYHLGDDVKSVVASATLEGLDR